MIFFRAIKVTMIFIKIHDEYIFMRLVKMYSVDSLYNKKFFVLLKRHLGMSCICVVLFY